MSDIDYTTPAETDVDRDRIDWHVRMARMWQARVDELDHSYQVELSRMRNEHEEKRASLAHNARWHEMPVESYHRMLHRRLDTDVQRTIDTPHGRSRLTVWVDPKVFVDDGEDEALIAWLERHAPDVLRRSLNVTDLRDAVDIDEDGQVTIADRSTGEMLSVPHVSAIVPDPSWSLKVDDGEPL